MVKPISMAIFFMYYNNKTIEMLRYEKNTKPFIRNNKPSNIIFYLNGKIAEKLYRNEYRKPYRNYGPASIQYDYDFNLIILTWTNNTVCKTVILMDSGYYSEHNKMDDINIWLKEKNIILCKENNYEIPDEHKAEFKLRFM